MALWVLLDHLDPKENMEKEDQLEVRGLQASEERGEDLVKMENLVLMDCQEKEVQMDPQEKEECLVFKEGQE